MEERNQDREFSFIKEKIKDKPINKRRLLFQSMWVIFCGVLFGVVSCTVFVLVKPGMENMTKPQQDATITIPKDQMEENVFLEESEFHEDSQENQELSQDSQLPLEQQGTISQDPAKQEDTSINSGGQQSGESLENQTDTLEENLENLPESQKQETVFVQQELDAKDMQQLQNLLYEIGEEAENSLVTVTGVVSDTDWFDLSYEKESQCSGMILANNGQELLVLTEKRIIDHAQEIIVTFANDEEVSATLKKDHRNTGLAVIGIPLEEISTDTMERIRLADLGNSYQVRPGTVVLAIGNPIGIGDAILPGTVISSSHTISVWDSNYTTFITDILGSTSGSGVLINLEGQVVGLVTQEYSQAAQQNTLTALSISQLKGVIEDLSNGKAIPYLGIKAVTVTEKIVSEYGIPKGVYVKNVEIDHESPAMKAGIQAGDVLTEVNGQTVKTVEQYTQKLMELTPEQSVRLTVLRQSGEEYVQLECEAVVGVLQ